MKPAKPGRKFEIMVLIIAFLVICAFIFLFKSFLKAMEGFNLSPG